MPLLEPQSVLFLTKEILIKEIIESDKNMYIPHLEEQNYEEFKGLGLEFEITPQINGCLIQQGKKCIRNYKFSRW